MSSKKKSTSDRPELSHEDETMLIWFFGEGSCYFEKSTCGSMLDALERDSCTSITCTKCRGAGIIGESDWTNPDSGSWCNSCNGTGCLPVTMKRSKHVLTAKPTQQNIGGNARPPDNWALTTYAIVSRRIDKMQTFTPVSVQTLCAFYGNAGTRWAQTEGYSRIFPVLALTRAGATLIKRSQGRVLLQDQIPDVPQDAHEQLGQLHLVNRVQPEGGRTKLFTEAFSQAELLVDIAVVDWLKTGGKNE